MLLVDLLKLSIDLLLFIPWLITASAVQNRMYIEMEPLELVVVALVTIIALCTTRMWWNISIGVCD